jgi:hypothetical protein
MTRLTCIVAQDGPKGRERHDDHGVQEDDGQHLANGLAGLCVVAVELSQVFAAEGILRDCSGLPGGGMIRHEALAPSVLVERDVPSAAYFAQ